MKRRLAAIVAAPILGLLALGAAATPAAAVTPAQKLSVMSTFTQTSATSYNSWNSARLNQGAWASYGFDWSTDYCSASPDQPSGFDFRLSCHRHDWGYRNYKDMSQFDANKARIDSAFYEDLKRKCGTYNSIVRPVCLGLAWTYYQAVSVFGNLAVSQAEVDKASAKKAQLEAQARAERAAGAS
ncbi:hypothetical protein GCM10009557_78320 [Virgisporangium ochraceum]|uniref:Phospholipase A2 n=1 Tax=Virgisporangium ochraceum TaxID=65505 RepID=A0A8J3ZWK0_9ACTN|nr:phospholipase [Virgisporangium ochraceum]GIJ68721.1 hypothetical protein Voc01_036380 [Virgisporangium ochraceum]